MFIYYIAVFQQFIDRNVYILYSSISAIYSCVNTTFMQLCMYVCCMHTHTYMNTCIHDTYAQAYG